MSFELIMLLGFFGTALLGLLPTTSARSTGKGHKVHRQHRGAPEGRGRSEHAGRVPCATKSSIRRLGAEARAAA